MVKAQLGIPREYWRHHHRLLLRIKRGGRGAGVRTMNAENGTFSPVAIFHSVATVGLDSFRSICPSMAFDTPVSSASRDRLQPRCWQQGFKRCRQMLRNIHPSSCFYCAKYTAICLIFSGRLTASYATGGEFFSQGSCANHRLVRYNAQ